MRDNGDVFVAVVLGREVTHGHANSVLEGRSTLLARIAWKLGLTAPQGLNDLRVFLPDLWPGQARDGFTEVVFLQARLRDRAETSLRRDHLRGLHRAADRARVDGRERQRHQTRGQRFSLREATLSKRKLPPPLEAQLQVTLRFGVTNQEQPQRQETRARRPRWPQVQSS